MFRSILFLSITLISPFSFAQNFTFVEGNLIETDIIMGESGSADSKIHNESDEAVVFAWQAVEIDHPADWDYTFCDFPNCYEAGVSSGTMSEVPGGSELAFVQINLMAPSAGIGIFSYAVWDIELPDLKDTVTFTFTAIDVTGSSELSPNDLCIRPTSNGFSISNTSNSWVNCSLYELSGKILIIERIEGNETRIMETNGLNPGLYFISFQMKGVMIETKKVIVR
ncbi:MAG: T9SS type A sorting domain-containing protein [Crocinitomicaceae bacterium]